jgi:hypothetical protein
MPLVISSALLYIECNSYRKNMAMKQKITPKDSAKTPRHKKLWITLAVVLGALLVLAGALEVNLQLRTHKLNSANQQIWNDAIRSTGATRQFSNTFGAHFWDICTDNGPCPRASEGWFVLVDTNGESRVQQKIMETLKNDGYKAGTINSTFGGTKDGVSLNFDLGPVGSLQPPYPAPAGKNWVQLGVTAFEEPRY